MYSKQLIPPYNNTASTNSSTATFSPVIGNTQSGKTNLKNVNNSGLLFVAQAAGGNANAACEIWGSIDGVNYSPLIKSITFSAASGGSAESKVYPVTLPIFVKLLLTNRAHTTENETSGVFVWAVY